jgi:predicted MFS family arabinose efflux permease
MADLGRWRDAFYLLGAVGVIYAVPYALFLRRVPESHRPSNAASPPPKFAAGTLARTPTFVLLCVAFPLFVFGLWLVYAWLPDFLGSKFRLNNEDAAFNAVVFQQGATLVGILSGGVLADRLYHRTKAARMWLLAVSFVGCAPALVGIGYAESLNSTRIAVVVYGLMSGLFMGNIFPTAYDVVPAATRATVVGALNLFGSLIAGFGPLFGGLAKKTIGIDALLALTGGIYLVGAVLVVGGVYTVFHRDHARIERL